MCLSYLLDRFFDEALAESSGVCEVDGELRIAVGAESVAKEPGVVCIFPMQKKESPTSIRIVEIYRSEEAYKEHLATPHFRKYKEGTPHMIKSLKLVPMRPLDVEHMNLIFKKEQ